MRNLFLSISLLVLTLFSLASASIEIRPYGGYGFPIDGSTVFQGSDTENNTHGTNIKDKQLYVNEGKGVNLGLGILVGLNKNMGIEIGGGYVLSPGGVVMRNKDNTTGADPVYMDTVFQSSSYIPVNLTFKIFTSYGRLKPFIGFGPTLALNGKSILASKTTRANANLNVEQTMELTYQNSFGLNSSIGADFEVSKVISLFLSANLYSISLKAKKMVITKYTKGGTDKLSSMDKIDKEFEFYDDIAGKVNAYNSDDVNKPNVGKAFSVPFNAISVNFGIALKF